MYENKCWVTKITLFGNPNQWGFMSICYSTLKLWISKQSYLMFYQKDWWLTEPHKNCISLGMYAYACKVIGIILVHILEIRLYHKICTYML